MKKGIFLIISLWIILVASLIPQKTLATTTNCCKIHTTFKYGGTTFFSGNCYGETSTNCTRPDGKELCPATIVNENWPVACMLNVVYLITDIAFNILVALAILVALGGGYYFIVGQDDPQKISKAKDFILYAILGILVALFAKVIPSIVVRLLG